MRYRPSSLLLGRDEIVGDNHQIALQSCLYHGSITHLKCNYGLATQISVTKNVQTQEERVNLVFAVEISLDNPDHILKPGMPADAEIAVQ